ncbi:MAG TPA: Smr/MutS family protein [Kofleriaceae bacterium]|jgi:dsDNA-specific endonuclease/ATPase MutS2|nr:Smr/MutS family protein [Kofleriaceae bacterium]
MPNDGNDNDNAAGAGERGGVTAVELTDSIDLHTFAPREIADLVDEYLRAAAEAGMTSVRIIHGKGTGTLRAIVHAALDRHPLVERYALADGNWGATVVQLRA